jgi:hypothetical protein
MAIAAWFRFPYESFAPALKQGGRRQSRRQPIRFRPILEHLEGRLLLDASSGVIGGGLDNPTLNAGFAAAGVTLPVLTSGLHGTDISGLSSSGSVQLASTADVLAQDQPNSQIRVFGVNSQGESSRLNQLATINVLMDAYGFGSGVQPNAPWAPAAYNLGLANHQFNYPTQTDMGLSSVPPWQRQIAYVRPNADTLNQLGEESNPESVLVHNPDWNHQRATRSVWDDEAGDKAKDRRRLFEQFDDEQHTPELRRDDPAVENALFTNNSYLREVVRRLNLQVRADSWMPSGKQALDRGDDVQGEKAPEDNSIPNALWLSALAPVPFASLATGDVAMEGPGESCEAAGAAAAE